MALVCITGGKECDGCGRCQVRSAALSVGSWQIDYTQGAVK